MKTPTHGTLGCKFYQIPIGKYDWYTHDTICGYVHKKVIVYKCGYCGRTWEITESAKIIRGTLK